MNKTIYYSVFVCVTVISLFMSCTSLLLLLGKDLILVIYLIV